MSEQPSTAETFHRLEDLFAHVWMVRTFIKHSEEADEDDELMEVQRELYDAMHSLGPFVDAQDHAGFIKQARRKLKKIRDATDLFVEIQPEISDHTSFRMAARSLKAAVDEIATRVSPPVTPTQSNDSES
ncbi:MAG: amidohydrolase [Pirellulaceae bacterium]